MAKGGRRQRHGGGQRGRPSAHHRSVSSTGGRASPRDEAEAALYRLVRANQPGKISLAGAYALGYGALGMAQRDDGGPDWYHDLDPLDTLFLGTVWPQDFRDSYEFANATEAWLRVVRNTMHGQGIERFVREALAASEEHDLPVDDGELMLLLMGRLEAADLDQRKLPRDLLPDRALEGSRLVYGPAKGFALPDLPTDAATQVAALWAATEIGLSNDGTVADALREGLHMLAGAGLDVRSDSMLLLPALYAGLVASDHENLSVAGERSVAWALGLADDSPLVQVTDVLLVAPERGLDVDTALGHLFGIPAFTGQVRTEDRRWHSSPGSALIRLAFELGYPQVITREGKTMRLGQGGSAAMEAQLRRFEGKFGRPPGPEDPVFFDPDADEPQPFSLPGLETQTVAMLEAAGVSPAWVYAYQHTDGLLPRLDGSFVSESDRTEWDEAVDRYMKLHQPHGQVDHEAETVKLQGILIAVTLQMAAEDPQYGASLIEGLGLPAARADLESNLLRRYLHAWADDLADDLCTNSVLRSAASENARAWVGADLAERVRNAAHASDGESIDDQVLLAAAVAGVQKRTDAS